MQTFFIKNLDCASCASKIEQKIRKAKGVRAAHISFATNTLSIDCDDMQSIKALIKSIEPEVEISKKSQTSTFLTPQLFVLLGLIVLFLVSLGIQHWWLQGEITHDSFGASMLIGIKILWIAIYLVSGRNVIKGAVRSFKNKEFFDENVLMLIASIAAFCIGEWEEAVSIMLFFATGEYLQEISVKKSKEAISDSTNLVPTIAHLLTRHSDLSDKNGNLHSGFRSSVSSKLPESLLDNQPSSQTLKCQETSPARDLQANLESSIDSKSYEMTESRFTQSHISLDSKADSESKQHLAITESKKNLESHVDSSFVGDVVDIDPKDLAVGDTIVLYAGEMLPCDATLLETNGSFNTAAISGESLPIESKMGDEILSGSIALNKAVKLRILRPFEKSQIAQIADLIANATMQKSPTENFITTFARYYTPVVLVFAMLLAIIPPLFFSQSFEDWIYRALVVLMVSCPCALVVSVPIGYFGGLAAASKRGALIKGSNYLEALSKLSTIAFDKTGTLTKGVFEVIDVIPSEGFNKKEVLVAALCAQNLSNHPIAQSIKKTYQKLAHNHTISEYEELSGLGVRAVCDSHEIIAGNDKILHAFNIAHDTCYVQGSVVHIVRDKQYLGYILIADVLKNEAIDVIATLKNLHIDSIILSGDGEYPCKVVADKLGCAYYHSLLPQDKAQIFASIKTESNGKVAFVGDGINDAPTLALADVGVAMGSGSDISHKSADVIIANNSLQTLVSVIRIAKKTKSIIYQNITFALGIKGVFIVLGLFGLAGIWEAVFADVGVALLALANAMRCMRV